MFQRACGRLVLRQAGAVSLCPLLYMQSKSDAMHRLEMEKFAKDFELKPMASHERSSFEYRGSEKSTEVGARNEAAFLNYEEFEPTSLKQKLAMPGYINLLTVTPVYCAVLCIGCAAWGIFYWDLYCRKNYETVLIARPDNAH